MKTKKYNIFEILKSTQATDNDTYSVLPNQPIEYEIEILSFGHLRQPIEQMNVEDCISDSLIKSKFLYDQLKK